MVRCDSDTVPLLAVNDLLWFLYLYPLRVLSAFDPRILIHPIGSLAEPFVQFRSRKPREMVMHRMGTIEKQILDHPGECEQWPSF